MTCLYGEFIDDHERHELCYASFVVVFIVKEIFAVLVFGFESCFHVGGELWIGRAVGQRSYDFSEADHNWEPVTYQLT